MKTLVVLLTIVFLAGPASNQTSIDAEQPFNINANDVLGVRLGSSLAEYSKLHPESFVGSQQSQECTGPDVDGAVSCFVFASNGLTVGDVSVYTYHLTFYDGRLIDIEYFLRPQRDWDPLVTSLQAKFGKPAAEDLTWRWQNSTSQVSFSVVKTDGEPKTKGLLRLWLKKETSNWLEKSRQRMNAAAKSGL